MAANAQAHTGTTGWKLSGKHTLELQEWQLSHKHIQGPRCGSSQSVHSGLAMCARNTNLKKELKPIPVLLLSFVELIAIFFMKTDALFSQIKHMYFFHLDKSYLKHVSKAKHQDNLLSNMPWPISTVARYSVYDGQMIPSFLASLSGSM